MCSFNHPERWPRENILVAALVENKSHGRLVLAQCHIYVHLGSWLEMLVGNLEIGRSKDTNSSASCVPY